MGDRGGPKPIVLWAVPRSASTAFERMVIERGDHQVLDEPFSAAYYFGPDQVSHRFAQSMPGSSYKQVQADIEAQRDRGPVFLKDMAYHAGPILSPDVVAGLTNSFLIRDPRWSIPSMAKVWPDVDLDEVGFHRLEDAFDLVRQVTGSTPPLIDSNDLLTNPEGVVKRWCDAVGIAPDPAALHWEAGMQPNWKLWPEWYEGAAASTGFGPPATEDAPAVHDVDLIELIAACLPVYERLREHRLLP